MGYQLIQVPEARPFPNNALPVIYYPAALTGENLADRMSALFHQNGWPGAWLNGVYAFHHFHALAHEVLGCARGWVTVRLGGPQGVDHTLRAGDVVLVPAGVGHCRVDASPDYLIAGSYPEGQSPDLERGEDNAFDRARAQVLQVRLPKADPVLGPEGPAVTEWKRG